MYAYHAIGRLSRVWCFELCDFYFLCPGTYNSDVHFRVCIFFLVLIPCSVVTNAVGVQGPETHTIVLLETILGPVQAALLALAIRRRFMR